MKKIILFILLSIVSVNMIHAQNCQFSEEAKHHWRRANAIAEDLKTSESYSKAIDEFVKVMVLAPECPDVYYNLSVLYSQWAELDNKDTYLRLNRAELFLKVCIALNPVNKEEAKNQLARLEIKRERITSKSGIRSLLISNPEDFLDQAYDCLKKGCSDALVERFYQLHKFIFRDNSRDEFEKYFLMAYSADSHCKKEEYKEAKEIYEEMLKSDFKDLYARKRYDELRLNPKISELFDETALEGEIFLHFTIDHTTLNEKDISSVNIFFDGKKIGYILHDALSITVKDPKPGKHKLRLEGKTNFSNASMIVAMSAMSSPTKIIIDTRKKKEF